MGTFRRVRRCRDVHGTAAAAATTGTTTVTHHINNITGIDAGDSLLCQSSRSKDPPHGALTWGGEGGGGAAFVWVWGEGGGGLPVKWRSPC